MDQDAQKTVLRMIPYGMYVLTTKSKDGNDVGAATVNWLTQTSFSPPLIAVGVKADSGAHQHIKDTGVFAVNVIGTEQKGHGLHVLQAPGARWQYHWGRGV